METPPDELRLGRLFMHGRLNDPLTGGQLYCRIRALEGNLVETRRSTTVQMAPSGSAQPGGCRLRASSRTPSAVQQEPNEGSIPSIIEIRSLADLQQP